MITNFESHTARLTKDEEKVLIPIVISTLKKFSDKAPIKSRELVGVVILRLKKRKKNNDIVVNGARLRKCCNYIRRNALLPIIATSKGYYVSYDRLTIDKQIKSLNERAGAIMACSRGLKKVLLSRPQIPLLNPKKLSVLDTRNKK